MPLVVLDSTVLADSIESDGYGAQLLTLLAYGATSQALAELDALDGDARCARGSASLAGAREQAQARWEILHNALYGLSDDWGLATSGIDLDAMRSDLEFSRALTHIDPYRAWRLVRDLVCAFAEEEQLDLLRERAPRAAARPTLVALATRAEFVIHGPFVPRRPRGLDSEVHRFRRTRRRFSDRRRHADLSRELNATYTLDDLTVRHFTLSEFRALDEAPDLDGVDGSFGLLEAVFPLGGSLRE